MDAANHAATHCRCPHCRTAEPHVVVKAADGRLAWCQTCFRVHLLATRPLPAEQPAVHLAAS